MWDHVRMRNSGFRLSGQHVWVANGGLFSEARASLPWDLRALDFDIPVRSLGLPRGVLEKIGFAMNENRNFHELAKKQAICKINGFAKTLKFVIIANFTSLRKNNLTYLQKME